MQIFYMIIGRDVLYLYEKNGTNYNRQYIEGNPEFYYQLNNMRNNIERLLQVLTEEYNLDSTLEITFVVIENDDPVVTEAVDRALERHISKQYDLSAIMPEIIKKMYVDGIPLIKEFGVNFDGRNYLLTNGKVNKCDYNLLAYTLNADEIIEYIG